jgi:hydrogenase/urease accessory protein HupE
VRSSRSVARKVGIALAFFLTLMTSIALAHKPGLSRGDYKLKGSTVEAELVFEKGELATLAPETDANQDGALDVAELKNARDALERKLLRGIEIKGDGKPCDGTLTDAHPVEGDGVLIGARFACGTTPKEISVHYAVFDALAFGHRHLVAFTAGSQSRDFVAHKNAASFTVPVGSDAGAAEKGSGPASAWSMFLLGLEHILTGYDHLVFLFGLILVGGRPRALVGVITAFTVAHSITLAMAALGVWAPSPRFVEPAIALSIAYVGVENFFVKSAEKRWRITFPFGLIHGFGFAGALQEIELPRDKLPLALGMFNVGVEAGQLAVLAVCLPLVMLTQKKPAFARRAVPALSGVIVVAGVAWAVQRIFWA